ncbi:MAG TPA: hypothetical protein VFE90_17565 [Myxococcales bacterium]|nr:hypothetical protein [Myxococcales bacterium]
MAGAGGRFSGLLLEGLDHYRKGRMLEAVRAWEEAYLLEPTNLRAREFLRSALERIHAHMSPSPEGAAGTPGTHPWLPGDRPAVEKTQAFPLPPLPVPPAPAAPVNGPSAPSKTAASAKPASPAKPATRERARPPPPPADANALLAKAAPLPAKAAPLPAKAATSPAKAARPPPKPPPPPPMPWDDGPSVAIPQPEDPGDETSGAWSIHKEALPIEAVADDDTAVWMRGARELLALDDFSGALELLNKVLDRKPGDKDATQLYQLCEENLTQMYESKIGAMDARPRTAIPPDEIIWLNLDPRAGFVLAQIDGEVSFDDLYAICGLKRLDTARILCELLEQGVVHVEGQKAVAKRSPLRPT